MSGPTLPLGPRPTLVVDRTHLSRRASGIERITRELFSEEALAPLPVTGWTSRGSRPAMIREQMLRMPAAALAHPRSLWLFSGYPPSPVFAALPERSVLYVNDLFLLTRRHELNRAARLYMVPPFRLALRRLRNFLVLSETTGATLRPWIRPDATVLLYRPPIRNVFSLSDALPEEAGAGDREDPNRPLVVGAMGTIEPRKNYSGAAALCAALSRRLGRPVELRIIGRPGWGGEAETLARLPHVRPLGFLDDDEARRAIGAFDLFLMSSHDEGLGLPLLEMQFAGLLVVAPDKPVFHEVLGASGLRVPIGDPEAAAAAVAAALARPDWRREAREAARHNLARWNRQAAGDREAVVDFLGRRLAALAGGRGGEADARDPAR
ncbi:glycosyltransferase [Methylobacterium sp. WSM2598]|uniref:glycosyltransferase n=1 Tax=Methylobacterium sp. WSM2598 TaxID=398261 RepID=UPI00036979BB|nr:glycosyltransferase [Methylobacterium sp. WSM2598]